MSGFPGPGAPGPQVPVYVISVAAELTGLHPQTLRSYERMGLITPGRTGGGGRRYSWNDIQMLRQVAELSSEGIGLEGVRRILGLQQQVGALQAQVAELEQELGAAHDALRRATAGARDARLPAVRPTGQAVTVWRRRGRR